MLSALATTLFFAVTPVFANRAAALVGCTRANFLRLLVALVALGAWAHGFGRGLGGVAFYYFVFGGVAGFGIGGLAMFQSLPRLGSNLSTLIVQCGSAVIAAALEWLWLGSRLSPAQMASAALALFGVALGLWPEDQTRKLSSHWRTGLLWAGLSALGQGAGAVISRKAFLVAAAAREQVDPGVAAYERGWGGLVVAGLALGWVTLRRLEQPNGKARLRDWSPWVLANALTGPVFGVTCYQWALRTTPAGIVQPIVAAAPLLTIPFAAWLEGVRPRPRYFVGAPLAVAGVTGLLLWR